MQLKEYLQLNGITGKHFAHKIGISQQYLSNILCGRQRPSLKLALEIEAKTKRKVRPGVWKVLNRKEIKEEKQT